MEIADPACAAMLGCFDILPLEEATVGHYAQITVNLLKTNQLIGTENIWIATAALANGLELITNNAAQFGRVAGLSMRRY